MKTFREFLNESNEIKMSQVNGVPSFLRSESGKIVSSKPTHQYVELNNFTKPVYVQIYFGSKETGKSLESEMSVKMDDVDTKKLFFGKAYYLKNKNKNIEIKAEKDLPK